MPECTVCRNVNDWFVTRCERCGSFLQNKVDTLNLFEMLWKLIEAPVAAFRKIVLAEHKNYVVVLSGFFGIALVFANLWFRQVGDRFDTLLSILVFGLLIGPVVGIGFLIVLSAIIHLLLRRLRISMRFRNTLAVSSYACAPIVFSLFLVFPIELMTFGPELFTSQLTLRTMNPTSFFLFAVLDGLAILWSLLLLSLGVHVLTNFQVLKSAGVALSSTALTLTPFFLF